MVAKKIKMKNIYRFLVLILPGILFFSYYPLISFGSNESMNFELSLPLIWLVVFAIVSIVMLIQQKKYSEIPKLFAWLLFPMFLAISLLWTHDHLRGILIGGVLALIYIAGFSLWIFRNIINDSKFWRKFFKVFLITGLVVCFWCLIQSILDVAGVGSDYSLICAGCAYKNFGFPHPNGFAAEPQFMGNLLLAPIVMSIYFLVRKKYFSRKFLISCLFVYISTLFFTLSRGAIYSFIAGLALFTIWWIIKTKKWQFLSILALAFVSFLFALNMQGIFSAVSKTDDTYISGVSKVVNQLSLGIIDLGGSQVKETTPTGKNETETKNESAIFDGYVEVSTNNRLSIWQGALKTWTKDPLTFLFGVGIGGDLKGMFENGNFYSSKEIINNQFVSLLLEGGVVGFSLLTFSLIMLFKIILKMKERIFMFTLAFIYIISLLFFSGLPNALHIYLLTAALIVFYKCKSNF